MGQAVPPSRCQMQLVLARILPIFDPSIQVRGIVASIINVTASDGLRCTHHGTVKVGVTHDKIKTSTNGGPLYLKLNTERESTCATPKERKNLYVILIVSVASSDNDMTGDYLKRCLFSPPCHAPGHQWTFHSPRPLTVVIL